MAMSEYGLKAEVAKHPILWSVFWLWIAVVSIVLVWATFRGNFAAAVVLSVLVAVYFLAALVVGSFAHRKGYDFSNWFFYSSFLLSPIGGFLLMLVLPPLGEKGSEGVKRFGSSVRDYVGGIQPEAAAGTAGKPTVSVAATPADSIESRLRNLADLRRKDLLTEEEYQKKRQVIIQNL